MYINPLNISLFQKPSQQGNSTSMAPGSQPLPQNEPGSSSLPTALQQILEPLQQNKMGPPRMQGPGPMPGMGQGAGLLGAGKCKCFMYIQFCTLLIGSSSDMVLSGTWFNELQCSWISLASMVSSDCAVSGNIKICT